ncbi:RNA polymerase sigma factor [Isoptericola sp. NPDC060257]|uniref:RNA polymerase sigma factor n=1 Tax=Isoptericola sp. NPDC060257 TaxID=3347087 RepID=UPI00364F70EC
MSTPDDAPDGAAARRERLSALWSAHAVRVQAYLWRHTDPDMAQDVLSETFLVAWRRLDDELAALAASAPLPEAAPEALAVERDALLRGLARLGEREREAILLVAWDGLAPADAADVAGCSTAAFPRPAAPRPTAARRLCGQHCRRPGRQPRRPSRHR